MASWQLPTDDEVNEKMIDDIIKANAGKADVKNAKFLKSLITGEAQDNTDDFFGFHTFYLNL